MGDILDRKDRLGELTDEDSEFKIIELFVKLIKQAFKAGGGFHCILGNHEFMNITGDFNYVSKAGMDHFHRWIKRKAENFLHPVVKCAVYSLIIGIQLLKLENTFSVTLVSAEK